MPSYGGGPSGPPARADMMIGVKRRGGPRPEQSTFRKVLSRAVSNLALPATAVITGPILARALGPEARGDVAAVITPLLFASYLFTFGVPQGISYRVALGVADPKRMVGPAIVLGLATGIVGAGVLLALDPLLLESKPHLLPLASALVVVLPALLIFSAVRAIYQGASDFSPVNREAWTSVGLRFGAVVVMAFLGLLNEETVAWSSQLALIGGGLTLFLGIRHIRSRREVVHDSRVYRPVLFYSSRVWVGTLSSLLIIRLDQVLMVPLTTSAQLGFYAVAVALAEVPTAGFAALRDVIFARSMAADGSAAVSLAARATVILFLPVGLVFCLVAPWAVPFVFGHAFAEATVMAQLLWLASLPAGLAGVFGVAMLGLNRPGIFSAMQVAVAAVNVVLMLLLVPILGGVGAAIASGTSYVLFAGAAACLLARFSGVPVHTLLVPRRADVSVLLQVVRRRGVA